ncbi:MAG: hypothetical protein NC833_04595 [Candidatus Omnitrophica bacterium]|nr:hypothetical protein [Candidatus Omnitrophota bacterium]
MEEEKEVNLFGFFQLFIFWVKDFFAYLDFLFSSRENVKQSPPIPNGLPEVGWCLQDDYNEGRISFWIAKIGDLFLRTPVITFLISFLGLRYFSSIRLRHIFLLIRFFSPRIIILFFFWLIKMVQHLTYFLTPLSATPTLQSLSPATLVYKGKILQPGIFDVLMEYLKLTFRRLFWFFVSLILLGIVVSLLFAEGFFWYNFCTHGLSPFVEPTDPTTKYFTISSLPFIGPIPPLYLDTTAWFTLFIPVVTLVLFILSIWDKLERMKLDQLPIFEFFELIFNPQRKGMSKYLMAYFALGTILVEVYFAYTVIFKYISEHSFIVESSPFTRGIISIILALFVPIIFTTFEVYAFFAMIRIWKNQIMPKYS